MEKQEFTGEIGYARVYPYVMSPQEIYQHFQEERLLFMNWFQRLIFWVRQTWLLLRGKRNVECIRWGLPSHEKVLGELERLIRKGG